MNIFPLMSERVEIKTPFIVIAERCLYGATAFILMTIVTVFVCTICTSCGQQPTLQNVQQTQTVSPAPQNNVLTATTTNTIQLEKEEPLTKEELEKQKIEKDKLTVASTSTNVIVGQNPVEPIQPAPLPPQYSDFNAGIVIDSTVVIADRQLMVTTIVTDSFFIRVFESNCLQIFIKKGAVVTYRTWINGKRELYLNEQLFHTF